VKYSKVVVAQRDRGCEVMDTMKRYLSFAKGWKEDDRALTLAWARVLLRWHVRWSRLEKNLIMNQGKRTRRAVEKPVSCTGKKKKSRKLLQRRMASGAGGICRGRRRVWHPLLNILDLPCERRAGLR